MPDFSGTDNTTTRSNRRVKKKKKKTIPRAERVRRHDRLTDIHQVRSVDKDPSTGGVVASPGFPLASGGRLVFRPTVVGPQAVELDDPLAPPPEPTAKGAHFRRLAERAASAVKEIERNSAQASSASEFSRDLPTVVRKRSEIGG